MFKELNGLEEELTISTEEKEKRLKLIALAFKGDPAAKKVLYEEYGMVSMSREGKTVYMTEKGHEGTEEKCDAVQSCGLLDENATGSEEGEGEVAYNERT